MDYQNLVPVTGVIQSITRGDDCCSQTLMLRTQDGIVNFVLSNATAVIDNRPLRRGMKITAFYDGSRSVPLIYPPRYQAELIAAPDRNGQVMLNFFDRTLTAADGSLKLNVGPRTQVQTINGQRFLCSPGNRTLLVYYTATTRSVPPQTTPQKIVVLCGEG